ncbi:hypothetical protein IQ251_09550 [Saccharopolyspora sp. HNM0983]|uniref:Uncharacterized protein n=1 Tax=Saccharopolyspora montiporae TaxID=2781240 RepID=A0A929FXH6_9PSEU|nr:hypothetical protein [Saccharopolyspora sp. HNM0983]MBE9374691.1 hypothetical protein [Saccharopolyspora sp. HNM0983]
MRTAFIHGETEQFAAAKAELITRCSGHADGEDIAPQASCLLDGKFARDGLLTWWSTEDVQRYLLRWAPRELQVPDFSAAPRFLHVWLDFLQEEGLLDTPDTADELHEAVEELTAAHKAAMADPGEWGADKFWSATMLEFGLDTGDPESVIGFMTGVESGEIDVDTDLAEQIEERDDAAEPPAVWLPPVVLPEDDPQQAEAEHTEALARASAVVEWIGSGRELDSDVSELAEKLGIDGFETGVLLEWVRHAGLVRVAGERLVPSVLAQPLLAEPGLLWDGLWRGVQQLADVLAEPLDELTDPAEAFSDVLGSMLTVLYVRDEPVSAEVLTEAAADLLAAGADDEEDEADEDTDEEAPEAGVDEVREVVRPLLSLWSALGAVRAMPDADDPAESEVFELTPLGLGAARASLRESGYRAPVAEELIPHSAEVVALVAADADGDALGVLVPGWIEFRGAEQAAEQLAGLLRRVDDPGIRITALWLLEQVGAPGVAAAAGLAEDPVAGHAVRVWLQGRQEGPEVRLEADDELLFVLDGMTAVAGDSPETVLEEFQEWTVDQQLAVVEKLPSTGHAGAGLLLGVLAELHPEERVARAADAALSRVSGAGVA